MTESEMLRMQQEAVRRAREMQNRARRGESPKPPPPPIPHHEPIPMPPPPPPRMERPVERPHSPPQNNSEGLLEVLFKDKEKTLILCLVLLLMDEKSDNSLILALLYLLI